MSSQSFVHLHVHTQYSLLQGAIRVKPLIERVKALGMQAVAVTDLHNLFGAVDFYLAAKSAGIKPILGCELAYAPDGVQETQHAPKKGFRSAEDQLKPQHYHLVVLCKDFVGYQNLCRMLTESYMNLGEAAKTRPVVTRELLNKYGDGLIVLTGCLRAELAWKTLNHQAQEAEETLKWFQNRFGEDFYIELQDTKIPEQDFVNDTLYQLGQRLKIACVATTDCHYLKPEEAEAQEILQCIEHGKTLDFERPKSLVPAENYLKDAETMREHFARYPGVCDETLKIADKCNVVFKFKDEKGNPIYHLPNFRPEGVSKEDNFDVSAYFRSQAKEGLKVRLAHPNMEPKRKNPQWPEMEKGYWARLEEEVEMIIRTGFAGYFLIVSDFIRWAKSHDIPVGPGRGSGAGSLVAYSLEITDLDPIEFNLLFERFINPERISMPDFDVDFCQDRRGEVIDYVRKKYGAENVSQIITFGKLQTRAVIKDVGRVLGMSFADTDQLTKLIPDELNIKLQDALDKEPQLREKIDTDPKLAKVFEYALALEGLYRNAGIHAAGVIITENPVYTYCPLFVGKDGDVVTQFDKDFAEKIGLVKFDFLGLKTLTVIDHAVKLIRKSGEPGSFEANFALDRMNMADAGVFELIGSGDTDGVFQVESSGMKDLCTRLQPSSVEDLTAINALYRPGPLGSGMVDDFIECKHGRQQIEYALPQLEKILKDTYGVILYQEQVMQIARDLAGYSLGQADMLRRAMGKKKADEMAKHKEIFVKGATDKGINGEIAGGIFDLMAKFAEYGFNKSHSAAYAVLTYQTAYLKKYYAAEFMAALMNTEMSNTEKLTKYIQDARSHKIPVLPPDVNLSQKKFSVEIIKSDRPDVPATRAVRFALEAIKGVGGVAVDSIIECREGPKDSEEAVRGPFRSVLDFCYRVSTRKVNKKVLEALTLAGAFDSISEVNRASLFSSLESLIQHAADEQEERELGQSSLFDSFRADEVKSMTPRDAIFKTEPDWPQSRKLQLEKQVVGFYVSGHPMDAWQSICEQWLGWSVEKLQAFVSERAKNNQNKPAQPAAPSYGSGGFQRPPRKEIKLGGILTEVKEITTKKGTRMAFVQLEDMTGTVELIFFPDAYAQVQQRLKEAAASSEAVIVTGDVELKDEQAKVLAREIAWAKDAYQNRAQQVTILIETRNVRPEQLRELKKSLLAHRGKCPVTIEFRDAEFRTRLDLPKSLGVEGSPALVKAIHQIFGAPVVQLR